VSIKRLNNFLQTADIDRNVVTRDPDGGKTVLLTTRMYWNYR